MAVHDEDSNVDVGRIVCLVSGLALVPCAAFFLFTGAALLFTVEITAGTLMGASLLLLLGAGFARMALRLLQNHRRSDGGLFSPLGISVAALVFAIGGVAFILLGVMESDLGSALTGATSLSSSLAMWRLADRRKRGSVR